MSFFKPAADGDPRVLRARVDLLLRAATGSWPVMLLLLVVSVATAAGSEQTCSGGSPGKRSTNRSP